jgi:hypothetical protein
MQCKFGRIVLPVLVATALALSSSQLYAQVSYAKGAAGLFYGGGNFGGIGTSWSQRNGSETSNLARNFPTPPGGFGIFHGYPMLPYGSHYYTQGPNWNYGDLYFYDDDWNYIGPPLVALCYQVDCLAASLKQFSNGDSWQTYFNLNQIRKSADGKTLAVADAGKFVENFRQVARNPQYRQISQLRGFVGVYAALHDLSQSGGEQPQLTANLKRSQ